MTNPIDASQRREQPMFDDVQSPTLHSAGPRELDIATLPATKLDYGQLAARLTTTSIAQTSSIVSPSAWSQAQLDAYRASFTASYNVAGTTVRVAPQFRMVGGFNDAVGAMGPRGFQATSSRAQELFAICARAHVGGAMHCVLGCPSAGEIKNVTQALIDAGKLPPGTGSLESRIKTMQWQWGIGIDCTDYVIGAALRASGKSESQVQFGGGPSLGNDYFAAADANPHLRKVGIASARPGDVFTLDAPRVPNQAPDVGHRAVVYSNTVCDAARLNALASQYGAAVTTFAAGGPVRAFEMDASWSAGQFGGGFGGVRRDTWLYNESTNQWAQINQRVSPPATPRFEVTPNGPANDVFHGVYRFQ